MDGTPGPAASQVKSEQGHDETEMPRINTGAGKLERNNNNIPKNIADGADKVGKVYLHFKPGWKKVKDDNWDNPDFGNPVIDSDTSLLPDRFFNQYGTEFQKCADNQYVLKWC